MVKCDICSKNIEETFLKKIKGTYIKTNKILKTICSDCQKRFKNNLLEQLK